MTTKAKRAHARGPAGGTRVIDATHRLAGTPAPLQPPTKGRLFHDREIPDAFLGGLPGIKNKVRWVREHLPRASRIRIGRSSAWFESDIRAYVESLGDGAGEMRDAG